MAVRRNAVIPDASDYLDEDDEFETTETVKKPAATKASKVASRLDDEEDEDLFADEDEDEIPRRSSVVQSGWAQAKKAMANSGGFTNDFKPSEESQLVAFLSDDPIAVFQQHWLQEKSTGRKSFTCLGEDECPLCNTLGHRPGQKIAFAIGLVSDAGVEVQIWTMGTRLAGQVEKLHNDPKSGPLTKGFWNVSRSGKGNSTSYAIQAVKPRDLAEDWDLDPEKVAAQLEKAKAKTPDASVIRVDTHKELLEIARDLAD